MKPQNLEIIRHANVQHGLAWVRRDVDVVITFDHVRFSLELLVGLFFGMGAVVNLKKIPSE